MVDKLVAVRVDGEGDGLVVTGVIHRGKNREDGWSFSARGMSRPEIVSRVEQEEQLRLGKAIAELTARHIKGASDDR